MPYPPPTRGVAALLLIIPFDCSFPFPSPSTATTGADCAQLFFWAAAQIQTKICWPGPWLGSPGYRERESPQLFFTQACSLLLGSTDKESHRERERDPERAAQSMRPMRDLELEVSSFFFLLSFYDFRFFFCYSRFHFSSVCVM